jgi:hypothetical protein
MLARMGERHAFRVCRRESEGRFFYGSACVLRASPDLSPSGAHASLSIAELGRTLRGMAPERVTLEKLVSEQRFDASNWRHRRALDESEPLDDPVLEAARLRALQFRGYSDAKVLSAAALREFEDAVTSG